jgi:hypothetical protein
MRNGTSKIDSVLFVRAAQLSAEELPRSTAFSNCEDRPNVKTGSLGELSEFLGGIVAVARRSRKAARLEGGRLLEQIRFARKICRP